MSRAQCLSRGPLGWRDSYEAGLAAVSDGDGSCAGVPRPLWGADASPGPDVSLSGLRGTARSLAQASHVSFFSVSIRGSFLS